MARILVADDSPAEREMLRRALAAAGHDVILACDGNEAEHHLRASPPDILVLDIVMPGRDGYQICRHLKADPQLSATPVIMISAKGLQSDIYWGLRQGACDYLVKPFSPDQLVATIARILASADDSDNGVAR